MNLLAIDFGRKRIGLAISRSEILASEYDTLENDSNIFNKLDAIFKQENIHQIVIGLPKNMDGTLGESAKLTKDFGKKLQNDFKLKIVYVDERLTTKEAERQLREMKLKDDEIKKRIDQYSAMLILEEYIT